MLQKLTTKRFRVIHPDGQQYGVLSASPDQHICDNSDAVAALLILINQGDTSSASVTTSLMLQEACRQNKVTIQEAFEAFWLAYGDPYVSGGKIEFRHLMKHITEKRDAAKVKLYSWTQMTDLVTSGKHAMSDFYCLNGKDGREEKKGRDGKPLWRLRE